MKYRSFNEQDFRTALMKKDEESKDFIKTCVISAIRNNPRFTIEPGESKSEASTIIEELKTSYHEIFEPYRAQPDEIEYDESKAETWNKEYFIRQTVLFGRNFSLQRYRNLIKIGQKVTPPSNFVEPQEIKTQAAKKPLPVKSILIATAALALVALVAIIVVKTLQ